jgi:hypothetical protein
MYYLRFTSLSFFLYYIISFFTFFCLNIATDDDWPPENEYFVGHEWSRMFCLGRLPEGRYGLTEPSWSIRSAFKDMPCGPQAWSALNFTTLADLCTKHGNKKGNYGGAVRIHRELFNLYIMTPMGGCIRTVFPP